MNRNWLRLFALGVFAAILLGVAAPLASSNLPTSLAPRTYYFRDSGGDGAWDDDWSGGAVAPIHPGEYMSNIPGSVQAFMPLQSDRWYYVYLDPTTTGGLNYGNYTVDLFLGNPIGPIDRAVLRVYLYRVDHDGSSPLRMGEAFGLVSTAGPGPQNFEFIFPGIQISLADQRLRVDIRVTWSGGNAPSIYWNGHIGEGDSRIRTPGEGVATWTPSLTPTATRTASCTATATATRTATATPSATPSATPTATDLPTPTPTASATDDPAATPTETATATPGAVPPYSRGVLLPVIAREAEP